MLPPPIPVSEAQALAGLFSVPGGDRGRGRCGGRGRFRGPLRRRIRAAGALTTASAQTAIQNYLDALQRGDVETIARHTLCGLFDARQGAPVRPRAGRPEQ